MRLIDQASLCAGERCGVALVYRAGVMVSSAESGLQGTRRGAAFGSALLLVLLAGAVDLRKPFTGDQALFVTGARAMMNGSVLYRDFWDLKQPGIYWFYWLALHLPVSAEVAVHGAELLYFLVFAGVILLTLSAGEHKRRSRITIASTAAVLCCCVYFVICGSWHLTQVEGLVGFPLYLSAWLLLGSRSSRQVSLGRLFFAGVATAVVILLKLMLCVLPICFLLLLLLSDRYRGRFLPKAVIAIAAFGFGVALVLGPLIALGASNHQLALIYQTFITIPARVTRELPHNKLTVLRSGITWAMLRLGPLMVLGLIGVWNRGRDLFQSGMIVWVVVGFGLILAQRMGWQYHFLLLLCPLGILAADGTAACLGSTGARTPALIPLWRRRMWQAIPVVLLLPYLAMEVVQMLHERQDPRPTYYSPFINDASPVLAGYAAPGPIYVMGSPLIYYLSGRPQAVALNGWSPEWLLDDQWIQLSAELRAKRPGYIFVDGDDNGVLLQRGQAFLKTLNDIYHPITHADNQTWYGINAKQDHDFFSSQKAALGG
jgi:hypothetical protein